VSVSDRNEFDAPMFLDPLPAVTLVLTSRLRRDGWGEKDMHRSGCRSAVSGSGSHF
jgi:hypothetical protein